MLKETELEKLDRHIDSMRNTVKSGILGDRDLRKFNRWLREAEEKRDKLIGERKEEK